MLVCIISHQFTKVIFILTWQPHPYTVKAFYKILRSKTPRTLRLVYSSGYVSTIKYVKRPRLFSEAFRYTERRRGRVVRAARLWYRKSPYRVSSRLGCAMRRLENLSTQQKMGTFFELGKDKAAKGEGWAPPFISCAQVTVGL